MSKRQICILSTCLSLLMMIGGIALSQPSTSPYSGSPSWMSGWNAYTGGTGILPAASGGAGSVSGILKGNGSGTVSAAAAGTDYCAATSGSSILKGNGAGGTTAASAGTDYCPATSGSAIQKGDGAGGLTAATAGTDYAPIPSVQTFPTTGDVTAVVGTAGAEIRVVYAAVRTENVSFAVPTGTPVAGQHLYFWLIDDSTPRTLTFSSAAGGFYAVASLPLPTTTVASTDLILHFMWNSVVGKWRFAGTS